MVFLDKNNEVILQCDLCRKHVEVLNKYDNSQMHLCVDCMMNTLQGSGDYGKQDSCETSEERGSSSEGKE